MKKIRLNIYRYLLLIPPFANLTPRLGYVQEDDRQRYLFSQDDTYHGALEEDYNDSDFDSDREFEALMKEIRRKKWEESNLEEVRRKLRHCRTPALLRANKQMYSEAYHLLYSELKIVLSPGAVLNQVMYPDPLAKPTGGIWRYDPTMGIGFKDINGHICYESECMDGDMEPHIFARFKKIVFIADFPIDEYGEPPALYIDENLRGKSENEAHFKDCIKSSAVIQRLVRLLSNSPLINHLEISLNFEVSVDYDYSNSSDDDGSDFDDEGFTTGERKIQNMTEAANERATELFLESGLLDPLQNLSNVQSFAITFDRMAYRRSDTPWQPPPRHASTIEELKKTMEMNWLNKLGRAH